MPYLRFLLAFSVSMSLTVAHAVDSRTVDLNDDVSRISFLLDLTYRHSRIHSLNQTFHRSIFNLFKMAKDLPAKTGMPAGPYAIEPGRVVGLQYFENSDSPTYDANKLQEIRQHLVQTAEQVFDKLEEKGHFPQLKTLEEDIAALTGEEPAGYFNFLPLLYDQSGHAKFDDLSSEEEQERLIRHLRKVSVEELEGAYSHFLKSASRIASKRVQAKIQSVQNNFVERFMAPRLVLQTASGQPAKRRRLSLEEVPPLVGLIRGAVGIDCSMNSVPFHAMLKGARVYWVRDSFNTAEAPLGYVMTLPVKVGKQVLPFVLTINGPGIEPSMISPLLDFVAVLWQTKKVAIPDDQDLKETINFESVVREIKRQNRTPNTGVPVHEDWLALDDQIEEREELTRYINYYSIRESEAVTLTVRKSKTVPHVTELAPSMNYQTIDYRGMDFIGRVRLGARLAKTLRPDSPDLNVIAQLLDVSAAQILAVRKLESANRDVLPPTDEYDSYLKDLGIEPIDLQNYVKTRPLAHMVRKLFYYDVQTVKDPRWQILARDLSEKITAEINKHLQREQNNKAASLKRVLTAISKEQNDAAEWLKLHQAFSRGRYTEALNTHRDLLIRVRNWTGKFWLQLENQAESFDRETLIKVIELAYRAADDFNLRAPLIKKLLARIPAPELAQLALRDDFARSQPVYYLTILEELKPQIEQIPLTTILDLQSDCVRRLPGKVICAFYLRPRALARFLADPIEEQIAILENLPQSYGPIFQLELVFNALRSDNEVLVRAAIRQVGQLGPFDSVLWMELLMLYNRLGPEDRLFLIDSLPVNRQHGWDSYVIHWMRRYNAEPDPALRKQIGKKLKKKNLWDDHFRCDEMLRP